MEKITLEQLAASIAEAVAKALPNASPDEQLNAGREMFEKQRSNHIDIDLSTTGAKWTAFIACALDNARNPDPRALAASAAATFGENHEFTGAVSTTVATSGGILVVPRFLSQDFIDYVRPATAILDQPGLNILDMVEPITIPGGDQAPVSRWKGENASHNASEITFRDVKLTPHQLICTVPASNLSLQTLPSIGQIIQRQSRLSMVQELDNALIYGEGGGNKPIGINTWALDGQRVPSDGTPDLEKVQNELTEAAELMDATNIPVESRFFLMSTRSKNFLRTLRTGDAGNGVYAFRSDIDGGSLEGARLRVSNQIRNDHDTSKSKVFLIDAAHWYVGMNPQVRVGVFPGAAYLDRNGNMQSGVANDQTVFSITMHADIAPSLVEAVSVIDDVVWKNGA